MCAPREPFDNDASGALVNQRLIGGCRRCGGESSVCDFGSRALVFYRVAHVAQEMGLTYVAKTGKIQRTQFFEEICPSF